MSPAETIARELTDRFLQNGNFASAGPMMSIGEHAKPASSGDDSELEAAFTDQGFAGLVVQGVGYEKGAADETVHIYVSRGSARKVRQIERDGEEVKVQINRVGKLIIRPEQATNFTHRGNLYLRRKRIACGSSCAPSGEQYSGTFGALVSKKGQPGQLYVLSNNHVLGACNHTPVDQPILAPSNVDSGPGIPAPSEIARHSEICELRSGEPRLVPPCEEDLAIARVVRSEVVSSWQGDAAEGYDTPSSEAVLQAGLKVKKWGRTTGLTRGTIESLIPTLMALPYKTRFFSSTVWFRNVWSIKGDGGEPFAVPGDSGSLVVSEDGTHAVGLVFAVSGTEYAFINPIDQVTRQFGGLKLVTGHGV